MRDGREWLGRYALAHRDGGNRLLHLLGVPLELWGWTALLWQLPVPASIGRPGLWAAGVLLAVFVFYQRLSRSLALGAAVLFIACVALCMAAQSLLGPGRMLVLALACMAAGMAAQFVGHRLEGSRIYWRGVGPHLLVGPAWLVSRVWRRLGLRY